MFLCSQPLITVLSPQYIPFNLTVILMSEEAFSEPHCSQEPAGHLASCHGEPTGYAALAARSPSPAVISIQNDHHEAIATSEFEIRHQYTEPSFLVSTKSGAKSQETVQRTKASKLKERGALEGEDEPGAPVSELEPEDVKQHQERQSSLAKTKSPDSLTGGQSLMITELPNSRIAPPSSTLF
ncbi:hypothetical protein BJX66DRAFT_178896 [Aspergillus keveii]|uniref:Uncharacterized protein n=1 Tax=Aspergillus keveii TaxID=714993 RepID=A0ABR4G7I4_9EURO